MFESKNKMKEENVRERERSAERLQGHTRPGRGSRGPGPTRWGLGPGPSARGSHGVVRWQRRGAPHRIERAASFLPGYPGPPLRNGELSRE